MRVQFSVKYLGVQIVTTLWKVNRFSTIAACSMPDCLECVPVFTEERRNKSPLFSGQSDNM